MLNIQLNGVTKFQADSLSYINGNDWNFITTTPPPVDDPNQLKRATIAYHEGSVANVDLTQMKNVYGRVSASDPIKDWGFANGSEPKIVLPATKHFRSTFTVAANAPTNETHFVKGVSYGSTNRPAYVKVYENGQVIFYADKDGRNSPLIFNDGPWIYFVVNGTQTPQKCRVVPGHTYEFEYGYVDGRGGTTVTHWV